MNNLEHQIHSAKNSRTQRLYSKNKAVFLKHAIVTSAYNKSNPGCHVVPYKQALEGEPTQCRNGEEKI